MPASRTMPSTRSHHDQRWVLPVVLLAVSLTAAAGLLARQVYTARASTDPPAVVQPSLSVAPEEQPGDAMVRGTADATSHPLYETVRQLLQTYFDAINAKNYRGWRAAVTSKRAENEPEREWQVAYRSTRDGSVVVHRIESGPVDSMRVLVSFTSVQNPEDAPLELAEPCIRWRVVLSLTVEGNDWKLDTGPTSATPEHDKC